MKTDIQGAKDLAKFRKVYNGPYLLKMAQESDKIMVVTLAIGAGKSTCMDGIIDAATSSSNYDLVAVLVPHRQIINERSLIKNPRADIKVLNYKPRPRARCGKNNNKLWLSMERNGLGLLGRSVICGNCQSKAGCFWPNQLKDNIKDCKVVFATQSHLKINPYFLHLLKALANANNILVLIDEVDFSLENSRQFITKQQLKNFLTALNQEKMIQPELIITIGSIFVNY